MGAKARWADVEEDDDFLQELQEQVRPQVIAFLEAMAEDGVTNLTGQYGYLEAEASEESQWPLGVAPARWRAEPRGDFVMQDLQSQLAESQLAAPPDFNGALESDYLLGVGATAERPITLLQIRNILSTEGSVVLPSFNPNAAVRGLESP